MVEVKIDAIRMNMAGSRVVILKDIESSRYLPIWIGEPEANAISIQLQGVKVARPITHDLIMRIIGEMGASVRHVLINDMRGDTYYARVVLTNREGREVSIDSRPSDALAIAVRCDCSILVDDEVMEKHAKQPEEDMASIADDDLGAFKDFLGSLDLDDLDDEEK
ncbi:MAG: bifunctional nuclease family protein [Chloroflexi bacterium]|nr:bifunctional nuclease family protein [Chloroflexota bacterium]